MNRDEIKPSLNTLTKDLDSLLIRPQRPIPSLSNKFIKKMIPLKIALSLMDELKSILTTIAIGINASERHKFLAKISPLKKKEHLNLLL